MAAELQVLQAGEERRGSNGSHAVDCCMETMVEQIFAMGTDQARSKFDAMCRMFFKRIETPAPPAQMLGKGGRRNGEDEHEQGKTSQQLVLPAPGGFNERTPTSGVGLDLLRAHGEGGGAGNSGAEKGAKKAFIQFPKSTLDGRGCTHMRIVHGNGMREPLCEEPKEERNSQGTDPRTFEENRQGGDLGAPETNSSGKDPRTMRKQPGRAPKNLSGKRP